ncbi:MAG: hypothetical protein KJS83_06420 [Xanthomonadaceae bacterium]|nr:hypothetical protein [Xanthomonadaceae bacterium]
MRSVEAAVVKSQGEDGRLRDGSGIECPGERPAKDGWAGVKRQAWLLADQKSQTRSILQ